MSLLRTHSTPFILATLVLLLVLNSQNNRDDFLAFNKEAFLDIAFVLLTITINSAFNIDLGLDYSRHQQYILTTSPFTFIADTL